MRILHLYKDYFPVLGGIENHIKWLAEGMAARGHDVSVLVTNTDRRDLSETVSGVGVVKVSRHFNISSAPIGLGMAGQLRRMGRDADVVHLHAPYPPGELARLLVAAGRRTVITWHSDIVKQAGLLRFYAPFLRAALHRADKILVASPPYVQSSAFLRPVSERSPEKIAVVPFGIDLSRYVENAELLAKVKTIRARYGPGPLVLFVGRMRYYKGLHVLVQAMAQVENARCLIVGVGPLEAEIRAQVTGLGLTERVLFAGEVDDADLPAYYQAADIFCLPSVHRSEALGIVLLEAMASGLPLISTELGTGTSWVNQHEVTGLVVSPEDPDALAGAINRLARNEDERRSFAQAAHARAADEFDVAQMLTRIEAIYREILKT
ncbi:MAG: glycosyltransferase [Caldilineaceae bacterium]|nr:glycosyltransferase [Caldilineaceae bacterium]